MLGKNERSIISPIARPNEAKIVSSKTVFSLLKPAEYISILAKNTVAKGDRIRVKNNGKVVAEAITILTTKLIIKTVTTSQELPLSNCSNQ